ncbi:MAG: AMP-binding protein [Spirochaetaceae bacterium]|nr:AMP-binding protein [Spirochaetaceae bacterium]
MNEILSRYCPRIDFESYEDFFANYKCNVPDNFNFAYDVVDEWARLYPDKLALTRTDDNGEVQSWSFSQIKYESDKAANALINIGIVKGDVVMLILKQRPEVWILMVALEKIGAVCIPATFQLTQKDIVYRCNIAQVKMLISVDDDELLENIISASKECSGLMHKGVVGKKVPQGFIDIQKAITKADASFTRPSGEADTKINEPMLIYFSSGTTGMPKMILHNHTLPLGHIVTAKYWQCVEDNKVHLTQTDSGWAKFAWGKIYGQWICGAAIGVYDTDKFTPLGILKALSKIKPYSFCAPATVFRYLMKEDLSGYDFSYISHTSVAGEPLSPEVFHKIKEKTGLEIREGFGQSETSVMAATFKWLPIKPGSMGKPAPLFGLSLLDENDQPCDDGIVGNISITTAGNNIYSQKPPMPSESVIPKVPINFQSTKQIPEGNLDFQSRRQIPEGNLDFQSRRQIPEGNLDFQSQRQIPGIFIGYWKEIEITKKSWYDGIYHTGDMAWRDSDGYYWFIGRNDDVIKCSGYRIGPFEVESALMEHPSILECAVTAAPDPMRGQIVKATIVLAQGFIPSEELKKELQNHVKRVTAPYKYPRIVEFVNELPKTISGKIQRNVIRGKDLS